MKICAAIVSLVGLCGVASADVWHDDGLERRSLIEVSGPLEMTGGSVSRGGTLVYDSSVQTGFRANAGQAGFTTGAPADPTRVLFDDVPITAAVLGGATSLDVCRVTVGIRRLANAPATDVNVFWSTMTTMVTAPDTNLDTPPTLLGTVSLAANGAAGLTELVTFGSTGGPTLFNVPLNGDLLTGFGTFAIGVSLSNADGANGWRITSGPAANANVFWLYDPNHTAQMNDEGAYAFSNTNPPNPPSSFYLIVEGNPVPAPGAAALLGLAGFMGFRRRR